MEEWYFSLILIDCFNQAYCLSSPWQKFVFTTCFSSRCFGPTCFSPRHYSPRRFSPRRFSPRRFSPRRFSFAHFFIFPMILTLSSLTRHQFIKRNWGNKQELQFQYFIYYNITLRYVYYTSRSSRAFTTSSQVDVSPTGAVLSSVQSQSSASSMLFWFTGTQCCLYCSGLSVALYKQSGHQEIRSQTSLSSANQVVDIVDVGEMNWPVEVELG